MCGVIGVWQVKGCRTRLIGHEQPGRINHHDDGRGVYWNDPRGHSLETITRPRVSAG